MTTKEYTRWVTDFNLDMKQCVPVVHISLAAQKKPNNSETTPYPAGALASAPPARRNGGGGTVLYTRPEFRVKKIFLGQIPHRFLVAARRTPVGDEQMRGVSRAFVRSPPESPRCDQKASGASGIFSCVLCVFWEALQCFDPLHGG
jgi:hypothetical protein